MHYTHHQKHSLALVDPMTEREEADPMYDDLTERIAWDIMVTKGKNALSSNIGWEHFGRKSSRKAERKKTDWLLSFLDELVRRDREVVRLARRIAELKREREVMVMERTAAKRGLVWYGFFAVTFGALLVLSAVSFFLWRIGVIELPVSPTSLSFLVTCLLGWSATCIAGFRSNVRKLG